MASTTMALSLPHRDHTIAVPVQAVLLEGALLMSTT